MSYPFEQEILQFMSFATKTEALYAQWGRQRGISQNLLNFLYALTSRKEPYTPTEFCDAWSMPKQTLTSIMREQEKLGHFKLLPVPGSAKQRHMQLTDAGMDYAETMLQPLWEAETRALSRMGMEKVRQMVKLEEEFNRAFTQELQINDQG